ncbi:LysR family transcriptional regulator [Corynebacterium provencense]|jgi:DNA-binding transcriptional LysR family regulator|uniref:LysR family transcriptional regulator n=1 Tax=Corynebacterium provencense TaxID=1737425 RepID=UPI00098F3DB4|nr:LysR family transcriptional regulator [Corynebacterium provencense]MCI1255682.1 LysR family transcriptional regulator [Corynebacterium provencense]
MNGRLSLESLRYADAVADAGSFSSAARRFGVTQPALSSSIAKLEDYLGGRLFLRNPRGTSPTAFGRAVLPRIRQVIIDLERVENEAEAFASQGHGTIRIGTSPQIEKALVAKLRGIIYGPEAYGPDSGSPARDATLLESELDQLEEYLQMGVLDMILVPALGLLPSYSHRLINSDYLVLVDPDAPHGHAPGELEPVTVRELAEKELILSRNGCGITRTVTALMDEAGLQLNQAEIEVANCSTLFSWVGRGMGSVVLPERNVAPGTPVRRIIRDDGTCAEMFNEMIWDPGSQDAVYLEGLSQRLAAPQTADQGKDPAQTIPQWAAGTGSHNRNH